jgi:hypothetical protein
MAFEINGAEIERELRQHMDRVHGPAPGFDARPELTAVLNADGSSARKHELTHRRVKGADSGPRPGQATPQDR